MVKKVLICVGLILLITGMVMAQNSSTVNQTGNSNVADVGQTGSNTSTVTQEGALQKATVTQNGTNTSDVDQYAEASSYGPGEQEATVIQDGAGNSFHIRGKRYCLADPPVDFQLLINHRAPTIRVQNINDFFF